jgi:hypothetical protein
VVGLDRKVLAGRGGGEGHGGVEVCRWVEETVDKRSVRRTGAGNGWVGRQRRGKPLSRARGWRPDEGRSMEGVWRWEGTWRTGGIWQEDE